MSTFLTLHVILSLIGIASGWWCSCNDRADQRDGMRASTKRSGFLGVFSRAV
jgi:hypothetical protein